MKLNSQQVVAIRRQYVRKHARKEGGRGWRSNAMELAREFGVSASYINQIARGDQRT